MKVNIYLLSTLFLTATLFLSAPANASERNEEERFSAKNDCSNNSKRNDEDERDHKERQDKEDKENKQEDENLKGGNIKLPINNGVALLLIAGVL
jgi:hypothetical protein